MQNTPAIRGERIEDVPTVRSVVQSAFRRPAEADLVDALRSANALVLSAVAVVSGQIVGHIAFSPVKIHSPDSTSSALALGPVAIAPDYQRQGIGAALTQWSLDECRRLGHDLVIVLGHPEYYPRFGFKPALPFGIECPFPAPSDTFMLLELLPNAAGRHRGMIQYRPEFDTV